MKHWSRTTYILNRIIASVLIIFLILSSWGKTDVFAERTRSTAETDDVCLQVISLADQAFDKVEAGQYSEARSLIIDLSETILNIKLGEHLPHVEQADMLLETVIGAKGALTQARINESEVYRNVLRLKLTIEAAVKGEQGSWVKFYPHLSDTILKLKEDIQLDQRDLFYKHLNQLYTHYEFIRPAILMSHTPQMLTRLDSLITYLERYSSQLWQDKNRTLQHIERLEHELAKAFYQDEAEASSLLWLTLGIALLIAVVLTYVGWKKYKGEQEEHPVLWKKTETSD